MWNAKADFIKLRQQPHQSVQDYYEKFVALRDVNEMLGNNIHDDLGLVDVIAREKESDLSAATGAEKPDMLQEGRGRMLAMHMLMGADCDRFGGAIMDFKHAYLMDRKNRSLKNLHDCYTLLKYWCKSP